MKIPLPLLAVVFALLTGLFWGNYGAALAKGRLGFQGSPWPPYVMIGFAYLVVGIGGGAIGMWLRGDPFVFIADGRMSGTTWSFIAGAVGALGALTLTLAMVNGGGPAAHVVMAIVFGTAVSVAGVIGAIQTRGTGTQTSPWLWVGMLGMVVCAVIVAYNTPHAGPHPKKSATENVAATAPAETPSAE